jgi:hypothetical protein
MITSLVITRTKGRRTVGRMAARRNRKAEFALVQLSRFPHSQSGVSGLTKGTRNAKQASRKKMLPIKPNVSPLRMLEAMNPRAETINRTQPRS